MKPRLTYLTLLCGLAATYFAAGLLGLHLRESSYAGAALWPPTGLALAAVVLWGYRVWPGLLAGALATGLVALGPAQPHALAWGGAVCGMAVGSTLEALVGAWLMRRFAQGGAAFLQTHSVLAFVALVGIVTTGIGTTTNVNAAVLGGLLPRSGLTVAWFVWWLGEVLSTIVLTPLILVWSRPQAGEWRASKQPAEAAVLGSLLLLVSGVAFGKMDATHLRGAPLNFLLVPLLAWTALRFGLRGTTVANLVVAGLAITGTLRGYGTFGKLEPDLSLMLVQNILAILTVLSLVLAADATQRENSESGLRASEHRYRELFESNPQPMWVFELGSLRFLAVNEAAIQHYGYSREEFLKMTIADIRPAEDVPALTTAAAQASHGQHFPQQWRHRKKDGSLIEVEISRQNLVFDGRPAAMVCCTDITAHKKAELEVLRLNEQLEQRVRERTGQLEAINKELEAFCYSVSHDLRAPLRSIRGFSEVLLQRYAGQLDERGQDFLRRSCDSSRHMDTLIEDLLKLSRLGRSEMKRQRVNLSALAQAIATELQESAPERRVDFRIAPNLQAEGDERLLRVVLDNLLRNAWKFTTKQPAARIEFDLASEPAGAFFVRDNGAGFDMAYAHRLFGVFQRLHTTSEFPGTGIGLATVQRVISRHGGRVWAEGAINGGATFYFTLAG